MACSALGQGRLAGSGTLATGELEAAVKEVLWDTAGSLTPGEVYEVLVRQQTLSCTNGDDHLGHSGQMIPLSEAPVGRRSPSFVSTGRVVVAAGVGMFAGRAHHLMARLGFGGAKAMTVWGLEDRCGSA